MHYYKWNLWRETRPIVHYFEFVKTVKKTIFNRCTFAIELNAIQNECYANSCNPRCR